MTVIQFGVFFSLWSDRRTVSPTELKLQYSKAKTTFFIFVQILQKPLVYQSNRNLYQNLLLLKLRNLREIVKIIHAICSIGDGPAPPSDYHTATWLLLGKRVVKMWFLVTQESPAPSNVSAFCSSFPNLGCLLSVSRTHFTIPTTLGAPC